MLWGKIKQGKRERECDWLILYKSVREGLTDMVCLSREPDVSISNKSVLGKENCPKFVWHIQEKAMRLVWLESSHKGNNSKR